MQTTYEFPTLSDNINNTNDIEFEYHENQCWVTINKEHYRVRECHIVSTEHSGSEVRLRVKKISKDDLITEWQDIIIQVSDIFSMIKIR